MEETVIAIIDPEGVLTETDMCRFRAWEQMAREQGILYDRNMDAQLRLLDRKGHLQGVLSRAHRAYSAAECMALLTRQGDLYDELLQKLGDDGLRPGAKRMLQGLISHHCKLAAVMTDGLPGRILCHMSIGRLFDAVSRRERLEDQLTDVQQKLLADTTDCLLVTTHPESAKTARKIGMCALLCAHTEKLETVLRQILDMMPEEAADK